MQNSPMMRLLLACSLVVGPLAAPALPQASPKRSAAAESHPRALGELKKEPSLVSKPPFSKDHPVVGECIAAHPKVNEIVKDNPAFFANLTATTPGGEHGEKKADGVNQQ